MPKQQHQIREFTKGIITSVSEGDIPENAATFNQNLDPIAESGVLKSLPEEQVLTSTGFSDTGGSDVTFGAEKVKVINDNGIHRAIMGAADAGVGSIIKVDDIWGAPTSEYLSTSISTSTNEFTMEVNNKEVHIGTGDGNTDTPKWAGIIANGQFGNTYSGIQLEDAVIDSPMSFPSMDDVGTDNAYVYGFNKEYNQLFRFIMGDNPMLDLVSTEIDCEEILCIDVLNTGTGASVSTADTRIFAVVRKYDASQTNYDTYRIKEFDYQFNEVLSNVKFHAGMTDGSDNFNVYIGSAETDVAGYFNNSLVPIRIKVQNVSGGIQIWLVTRGHMTFYGTEIKRRLLSGDYIWNTAAIEPTDGQFYELTCRTPFNFCTQENYNVGSYAFPNSANYGFFVQANDANENPSAVLNTALNTFNLEVLSMLNVKDYDAGEGIGIITVFQNDSLVWPQNTATGAGSKTCLKVSGSEYVRCRVMYIVIKKDFNESTTWFLDAAGFTCYQPAPLFTTDHGNYTTLSTADCMIYHFGKPPTHNDTYETHADTGGWAFKKNTDETFQNAHVNPHADAVLDEYGTCSFKDWDDTSGFTGDYYVRKFANPNAGQTSIGYSGGASTGHSVALLDEKDSVDTILNGHYIPETATKMTVLFGRSNTDEAQLGIWVPSSGNWYASEADMEDDAYTKSDGGMLNLVIQNTTAQTSTFINGYRYFYKVSFVYDGYQESPLTPSIFHDYTDTTNENSIIVEIGISENVNKRVSHLVLYRADSGGSILGLKPLGFYRQVAYIPLIHPDFSHSNNIHTISYTDNGSSGVSYEASSGLPEGLLKCTPKYALSTQLNNTHFISKINFPLLGSDLSNYMLKSMPYNFDQFDWTKDILKLPTTPTALAAFNGRIYAFDENNTYRIEPNNLYIEDTFEGSGCLSPDSVVVTEYGMFYCDRNNIYMHDGNRPTPIADAILSPNDNLIYSWHNLSFDSYKPKLSFDSKRKSVIISVGYLGYYFYWVYNILRQRWDNVSHGTLTSNTTPVLASFPSKEGEIVVQIGGKFYKLFANTSSKRKWSWYSKKLDMGSVVTDKLFSRSTFIGSADVHSTGLPITIQTSSGQLNSKVFYSYTDAGEYRYAVDKDKKGKWIQYRLSSISGDTEIDSIGTSYKVK